jgi:hypothetical protein
MIGSGPKITQLRETPDAAPAGAPVIDANFTVVRHAKETRTKKKRSIAARIKWWLGAIAITLLVGFMIPPMALIANAFLSATG